MRNSSSSSSLSSFRGRAVTWAGGRERKRGRGILPQDGYPDKLIASPHTFHRYTLPAIRDLSVKSTTLREILVKSCLKGVFAYVALPGAVSMSPPPMSTFLIPMLCSVFHIILPPRGRGCIVSDRSKRGAKPTTTAETQSIMLLSFFLSFSSFLLGRLSTPLPPLSPPSVFNPTGETKDHSWSAVCTQVQTVDFRK